LSEDKKNTGAIEYFHNRIQDFDDIYKEQTGLSGFLNRKIRASVKARFDLTFRTLGDLTGRNLLDVGCGSGRYMFTALEKGAAEVVGIDAAEGALEFAREKARQLDVLDKMKFYQSDFLDFHDSSKFDVILAIGYFDYIFDPKLHLARMIELSGGVIIASFPKVWSFWTPIRKLRLFLNHCPVRFYTRNAVRRLAEESGAKDFEIISVYRDNILMARN